MNINQLIDFFNKTELKNEPVKLNQCTVINDPKLFVKTHIEYIKANRGNKAFMPYYNRLLTFYHLIKNERPIDNNV